MRLIYEYKYLYFLTRIVTSNCDIYNLFLEDTWNISFWGQQYEENCLFFCFSTKSFDFSHKPKFSKEINEQKAMLNSGNTVSIVFVRYFFVFFFFFCPPFQKQQKWLDNFIFFCFFLFCKGDYLLSCHLLAGYRTIVFIKNLLFEFLFADIYILKNHIIYVHVYNSGPVTGMDHTWSSDLGNMWLFLVHIFFCDDILWTVGR